MPHATREGRSSPLVWTIAVAGLLLAAGASLFLGARLLSPAEVLDGLTGTGNTTAVLVVADLRLPRTLLGLLAGAGLAVAGAVMQAITRNPIASPSVLGINAGAAFAVVAAVDLLGITSALGYTGFALLGAAVTAVLAYTLATAGGSAGPTRLALAGAVIATMLSAWTTTMLVLSGQTLEEARHWLAGSLVSRGTDALYVAAPLIVLGLVLAAGLTRGLDALVLGDEQAASLGLRPARIRLWGALAVVLLAGASVAAAGPIAFIGLVVPHAVRMVVGSGHGRLVPACALAGPILLLSADVAGRLIARPAELEVGIVTAVIGAPVLIALARRAGEPAR
ncbi:FecCD family ABC transporter permease [Amycolatopsis panacis]|uniref:Iron ABC transporter permease n=1 Tax=Amycolatopsis panacis TaxID=2340917 RepID=A0A419HPQ8_9PSEU|nr:iron ABC transporter permease [Amycolatopsis panacis]RJQ78375.1 iron ABC transporter permease [Amycolatopsis panacis]